MNKTVFLRQVLQEMDKKDASGNPLSFNISVLTFNRQNKMGGSVRNYFGAKLLVGKRRTSGRKTLSVEHFYDEAKVKRNPNHWENRTRNIELPDGSIKKINILFIKSFNGLQVIY